MFAPRSSSLQPISEQATWQPPGTGFGAPALGQDHAGGQTHGAGWSMDPPPPSFQTHRFGTAANRRSTPFAGLSSSMNMMGSQLLAGGRRMMGEGVGGYPDRMVGQGFVQTPDTNQASGNTRIPWLVKQQDPASLQVEGPRPPPAPDEAPKGIQAANLLRRNQFLETLRRKRAAALASQREDSTAPQAVEIRTLTTLVAQERSWLRPLLLAVTSGAQRLALRLQKMLWRSLAVLTDPEALLEPMFLEAQEMMGQGFPSSSADVQSWVVQEDGLFRAAFGAHVTEPWNRERLYLQLERSVLAKPGPTLDERAQELRSDEDREMLGSGLCAPRLAPLEEVYWLNMLGLRFRSQVKSKRRHLVASHLYELRLDVSRISLFQSPLASRDLASRASSLDALDSRETRVAGELQELFHRYQKEMESHVVAQLDSRLDMLVERGKALRTALFEAEALPSDAQATQAAQAVLAAREAYRSNLQERRKVRARRDEKETLFEQVCKNLYGKWRELRQVRQDFGFVSTPWRLTAQPQEHDLSADTERRARNVDAEIEESSYLQGFAAEQERDRVQNKWDMAKRGPGQPSYRFELSPTVELTSAEALRSRAYDGIVGDADASSAAEELERRQLASRVRVCVECRVSDRVVGRSPAMSISWDTGSTSSAAALLEEVPGTLPGAPDSIRPVHSFNLAVHVMPQNISFLVYVSAGGWWPRWHAAREVQLDIPSPEGRRVTHAAVLEQHLLFGPGMDDLGEEDGLLSQTFKGEVAVCVSWPGGGRGDYVVPPPAPLNAEGQPVANLKCLPCFRSRSPASQKEEAKPEEELDKMRIDSEAPEVGTTSTEFRGKGPEGTRLEDAHLCRRRLGSEDPQAGQLRGLRVEKLLQRVERAGMDSERLLVPGFESEVREEKEAKQKQEASDTKAGKQKESVYQMDFRKRIEERTRKMAMVKTHMSYKSIVREYGEEAEEGNLLELLERFQKMFQPKHTLRPSGGRRRFESSVKSIRVHISLAKVYDAPLRWQQEAVAQQSAPPPPLGGVPGLQTFGAPVAGPGRGFQWPRQMGSPFAGSSEGVFGATPAGIQTQQLPEIVIEMTLQDFHGNLLFKRTERAQQSTDPDINQILELPLHAAGIAGMEELTQENLIKYSGELTINVFDELSQRLPGSGQEVRVRTQLRHLGKFVLPWDTLYAANCSVKGHFPVDQHVVLFGYRPKSEKQRPLAPVHAEGAPPPPPSSQAAKMMCLGLEVTVDPPLEHPTRVQPQITLGKEPNMMLKHVQKWHDLLKSRRDSRILALGTDVDGRSCLICRFIRPQKPPDILPENPFAIEMAARYVSMIPSLQDNEMWNVEDLWCTDQEFLDIQCGDWEEHCILLCNFFNYIDRYRRECVGGYSTSDIQSYCVICDLMPEGEAVVVLRMDRQSGNCEFWHALKGRCYFLPAAAAKQRWSLCPRGTDGTEDDAAQPDTQQASVLKAMTSIPIRKVHLVFNADNVWANLQSERAKSAHKGVAALSWDLDDARRWKPLFARGREDLRRLSGLPPDPTGEDDLVRDFSKEWRLEDPSQALTFQPKDEPQAARLENIFQLQLEQDIIDHRAGLKGTIVKDSRSTKFNHVIADRLGQLLEGLETLANSARRSGYESSFPLKSHATPPVTLEAIEAQMHEIENDFRRMGRPGRSVFGLPFNEPYKDYSLIWDAIYQSRILELGGDQADYALKVRIFPYAAGVLSIWVFIAAAMDV